MVEKFSTRKRFCHSNAGIAPTTTGKAQKNWILNRKQKKYIPDFIKAVSYPMFAISNGLPELSMNSFLALKHQLELYQDMNSEGKEEHICCLVYQSGPIVQA